jgi:hypothetical protein
MKKNEVAVKQESTAPVVQQQTQDWGDDEFTSNDLLISKILPMQMMSKKVADEKAAFGEFRDSVTNELLGSVQKPLEFIPINVKKIWIENEVQPDGKLKYIQTYPMTAVNEGLPWNEEKDGRKLSRTQVYNVFVLLPRDVSGGGLPKILSFRSTSLKAGKKLITQISTNRFAGGGNADKVMKLVGVKTKNDMGTFVVLDVELSRDSSQEEKDKAFFWATQLKARAASIKVDDAEEHAPEAGPVGDTGEF